MTTAKKTLTATHQSQTDDGSSSATSVEIEQTRRLKVRGLSFEETTTNNKGSISLTGPGIDNQELTEEDVSNIVRFFVGFQRRSQRDDGAVVDGRGQVTNPATDARLKGNEEQTSKGKTK
jgi:hypothetical protein